MFMRAVNAVTRLQRCAYFTVKMNASEQQNVLPQGAL